MAHKRVFAELVQESAEPIPIECTNELLKKIKTKNIHIKDSRKLKCKTTTKAAEYMRLYRSKPGVREKEREKDRTRKTIKRKNRTEAEIAAEKFNRKKRNGERAKTSTGLISVPNVKSTTSRIDKESVNKRVLYRIHTETELLRINRIYHTVEHLDKDYHFDDGTWVEALQKSENGALQHHIVSETTKPAGTLRIENDDVLRAVCRFR